MREALSVVTWNKKPFASMMRGLLRDSPALPTGLNFDDPKRMVVMSWWTGWSTRSRACRKPIDLYQTVAYALFDTHNRYGITTIAIYSARYGHHTQ